MLCNRGNIKFSSSNNRRTHRERTGREEKEKDVTRAAITEKGAGKERWPGGKEEKEREKEMAFAQTAVIKCKYCVHPAKLIFDVDVAQSDPAIRSSFEESRIRRLRSAR